MADGNRPWFHPSLGRMETERLLVDCSHDGSFLIRPSETMKGAYVLSLMCVGLHTPYKSNLGREEIRELKESKKMTMFCAH